MWIACKSIIDALQVSSHYPISSFMDICMKSLEVVKLVTLLVEAGMSQFFVCTACTLSWILKTATSVLCNTRFRLFRMPSMLATYASWASYRKLCVGSEGCKCHIWPVIYIMNWSLSTSGIISIYCQHQVVHHTGKRRLLELTTLSTYKEISL